MTNKEKYAQFCALTYVPIYSKAWWLDAVCGAENWDVWLYETGGRIDAAMPYYLEQRAAGLYITKAKLTQNNGIIFRHPANGGKIAHAKLEEKAIDAACRFIEEMQLAVYEQQYQPSFQNWLPFSWNGYTALPRYTYIIEDTSDIDAVWAGISSDYRRNVRKGNRCGTIHEGLSPERFYEEHAKVFEKQNLPVPFSYDFWMRLYNTLTEHNACKILYAEDQGVISGVLFLVWDEKYVYHLLGGAIPELSTLETYEALTWQGINLAHTMGLAYDFEGSMIKHISKSFREFGGEPKLYFRIRKVFSPEVIRAEAEQQIERLGRE